MRLLQLYTYEYTLTPRDSGTVCTAYKAPRCVSNDIPSLSILSLAGGFVRLAHRNAVLHLRLDESASIRLRNAHELKRLQYSRLQYQGCDQVILHISMTPCPMRGMTVYNMCATARVQPIFKGGARGLEGTPSPSLLPRARLGPTQHKLKQIEMRGRPHTCCGHDTARPAPPALKGGMFLAVVVGSLHLEALQVLPEPPC